MRNLLVVLAATSLVLGGCPSPPVVDDTPEMDPLLIFHNNSGPMCLAALDWLETMQVAHPTLHVEEHLTFEPGEIELLATLEADHPESQGVSASFQYLPIMFFEGQAFSGFDDQVAQALEALLSAAGDPA